MRRLEGETGIEPADLGGLYVLLARAALELNDQESAAFYAEEAMARLPDSDEREAAAKLVLADIHMAQQEFESARQVYGEVIAAAPGTDTAIRARFGRAVVRGVLGLHPEDNQDFAAVIEANQDAGRAGPAVSRDDVAAALADRHDAALTSLQLERALEYIRLAEGMYDHHETPAEVLFRLASTSRQAAVDLLEREDAAWRDEPPGEIALGLETAKVSPETRRQAADLFTEAADAFIRHARRMAGRLGEDEAWARSLWLAADSFDLAGDRRRAIGVFEEYLAGRPEDDPRRAEVMYRLAQALRAEGELERAADVLGELVDAYPRSTWGTRSHVPLARCYAALDRRPEAVAQLQRVLDGAYPIGPDAVDYRLAMLELGRLRHESGELREAIELLDATVRLAGAEDAWRPEAAYRLADSYRRLAAEIERKLESSPDIRLPADRATMKAERLTYLTRARDLFAIAAHEFAQRPAGTLDEADQTMERLAWLYGGDCAFELGEYAAAVETYDQAARRFAEHHSSMHALVQIVNCYLRMGDAARAELAHEHAVYRLRELPDEVFDSPDAVMDRGAWERWLKQRPVEMAMPSDTPAAETRLP
jgi:tetratricopeptide (TPR) repeat protein